MKILLTALLLLLFISSHSVAQDGGCETEAPINPVEISSYGIEAKTISFYFNIVRDDFGQGGQTDQEVNEQINLLFGDLANWSISGVEVGREIIKSSYYLNYNGGKFSGLTNLNSHSNAIDIYFTGSYGLSRANGIPGNACVLTFNGISNRLISHEVGHCLGLLHTDEERVTCQDVTGNYPQCFECGDKVCDTPPDPGLFRDGSNVNSDCEFTGDTNLWNPDTRNIMSYTPYHCALWFTEGQGMRMHWYLDHEQVLINTYFYILAPSNLHWSNQDERPLLQWNQVSHSNLSGYCVYRNLNGCGINCGSYSMIAELSSSQTSYLDTSVEIGDRFATEEVYYYVTAFTTSNIESVNSNRVSIPTNIAQKIVFNQNIEKEKFSNSLNIFPNPLNPSSKIIYTLSSESNIKIVIYDLLGRELDILYNGVKERGTFEIIFNSNILSSGIYILSLRIYENTNTFQINRKLALLK